MFLARFFKAAFVVVLSPSLWADDVAPLAPAVITIKAQQWLGKSSFIKAAPIYYLDVYASENGMPNIIERQPWDSGDPKKSPDFIKTIALSKDNLVNLTLDIPSDVKVYLNSYFQQNTSAFLNPGESRYCSSLESITALSGGNYILDINFIAKGPISGECYSRLFTPEQYVQSRSNNHELTEVVSLSRKVLSLKYGGYFAAQMAAMQISHSNDYDSIYLDAAIDRLFLESNRQDKNNLAAVTWIAKIVSESNSQEHLLALNAIYFSASQKNKIFANKIKKYTDKKLSAAPNESYKPQLITAIDGYSLDQLKVLATKENFKSNSKPELEGAAREVMAGEHRFDVETFDLALQRLYDYALSENGEEVAQAIWMVRAIAVSKNPVYITPLTELQKRPLHTKLSKEIKNALLLLTAT